MRTKASISPHCFYLVMFCLRTHTHTHTHTHKPQNLSCFFWWWNRNTHPLLFPFSTPLILHFLSALITPPEPPILLSITTICLFFSINVTLHFLPASCSVFVYLIFLYTNTHTYSHSRDGRKFLYIKMTDTFFTLQNILLNKTRLILGFVLESWHNFFYWIFIFWFISAFQSPKKYFNKTGHNALKE